MTLYETDVTLCPLEQVALMREGKWHDQPADHQEDSSAHNARDPQSVEPKQSLRYVPVQQAEIDWAILGLMLGSTQSASQAVA